MIRLYQRVAKRCQTINNWNRIHIAFEKRMTPLQLAIFCEQELSKRIEKNTHTKIWLEKLYNFYIKSGKKKPESFKATRINKHMRLYSSEIRPKSNKTLLICFTGSGRRMMMPLPVFLQHFNAKEVDIVIVHYPINRFGHKGYHYGLEGIGENFKSTVINLDTILDSSKYERVATIGVSAGGVPAILSALVNNYSIALVVGANSPKDNRWKSALSIDVGSFAKNYRQNTTILPKLLLLFGSANERDKKSAMQWSEIIPSKLISILSADHLAFQPLLENGNLSNFFIKNLFQTSTKHTLDI